MKLNQARTLLSLAAVIAIMASCGGGSQPQSVGEQASPTVQPKATSSLDVVRISSTPMTVTAGGAAQAIVTLTISPGFHVNANPATFPYLIATKFEPGQSKGLTTSAPLYPAGQKKKFQFEEQPLSVYEGEVQIKVPLRIAKDVPKGPRSLPISVTVQACDHEQCYAPGILNAMLAVEVN